MDATVCDGASTNHAANSDQQSARCASKSGSQTLSPDILLWATVEGSPERRSRMPGREHLDQFGSGTGKPDVAVVKARFPRSEQRVAVGRASRLEPLVTVGETAAILNVSV
jgi:hypothetical protein